MKPLTEMMQLIDTHSVAWVEASLENHRGYED